MNENRISRPDAKESAFGVVWDWFARAGEQPAVLDADLAQLLPETAWCWRGLRHALLSQTVPRPVVDAVWVWLVQRSRTAGGEATMACAAMAAPMLKVLGDWLTGPQEDERADIESALLTGFLSELAGIDLDRPCVVYRLKWATFHHGRAWIKAENRAPTPEDTSEASSLLRENPEHQHQLKVEAGLMRPQPGHPESLLAEAVVDGAISMEAALLILETRFEQRTLTAVAAERGASYSRLHHVRHRAEARLKQWLAERATDQYATSSVEAEALQSVTLAARIHRAPEPRAATSGREMSGPVAKTAPANGVLVRGGTSTAPAHPASTEEVRRRCA